MIKNIITICALTFCSHIYAQINELGVSVGATNFIGDIGATAFVAPKDLSYGIMYRWNRSPRHSWRASYQYLKLSGKDASSDMGYRQIRNLKFDNQVHEASLGIEFNFFEFDLHNEWFSITPYVFAGVAGIAYNEKYFDEYKVAHKIDDGFALAIPASLGLKAQVDKRFVISAEVGFRYALTDNLDGNHPTASSYEKNQFGNTRNNDWYMYSGITLTYTFGKNPCYCTPQ